MKCPRCDKPMTTGRYAGQRCSLCESCGGVHLKQKCLTRVLEKLVPDIADKVDINVEIAAVKDEGSIEKCPNCKGSTEYYGYMGSQKVMIDYCPTCKALWIDPLEFGVMAQMYLKVGKIRLRERELNSGRADIVGAYATSQAISGAFLLGFTLGEL